MEERLGKQLGNYRLLRLLGQGGFADVYLGEHIHLRTQAAIKVLQLRLVENSIQNFLNEARTIAHLVHPYIIRVLDFGVQENTPFLVMDYAPKGTFRQRFLRGKPLPPTPLFPYIKQAAIALQYAHDKKLIHRDVKPENMLLGPNEEVLLSDFGFALMQSSISRTPTETAGTAAYMAPEQLQGKPRQASDQYALGIVAYEWLTGGCPFQGSFFEIASQHMLTPPPPVRERNPGVSKEVEGVIMTALEKDPSLRFPTVRDFATALERACLVAKTFTVANPPTPAPPPFLNPLTAPRISAVRPPMDGSAISQTRNLSDRGNSAVFSSRKLPAAELPPMTRGEAPSGNPTSSQVFPTQTDQTHQSITPPAWQNGRSQANLPLARPQNSSQGQSVLRPAAPPSPVSQAKLQPFASEISSQSAHHPTLGRVPVNGAAPVYPAQAGTPSLPREPQVQANMNPLMEAQNTQLPDRTSLSQSRVHPIPPRPVTQKIASVQAQAFPSGPLPFMPENLPQSDLHATTAKTPIPGQQLPAGTTSGVFATTGRQNSQSGLPPLMPEGLSQPDLRAVTAKNRVPLSSSSPIKHEVTSDPSIAAGGAMFPVSPLPMPPVAQSALSPVSSSQISQAGMRAFGFQEHISPAHLPPFAEPPISRDAVMASSQDKKRPFPADASALSSMRASEVKPVVASPAATRNLYASAAANQLSTRAFSSALKSSPLPARTKNTNVSVMIILIVCVLVLIIGIGAFLYNMEANQASATAALQLHATATQTARRAAASATAMAQSTAIAMATATARANANPYTQTGQLVLNDPLSTNNLSWLEATGACQFIQGSYHALANDGIFTPCLESAMTYSDFTYEVQMKFVQTAPSYSAGGIIFRGNSANEFYYFEVYKSGRYTLSRCAGLAYCIVLAGGAASTPFPAFNTVDGQTNTLGVVATGSTIRIYINHMQVGDPITDATLAAGEIGVLAYNGNPRGATLTTTEVAFSDARLWK